MVTVGNSIGTEQLEATACSRAAKRAATAQRILEAARAEFGEHGLEAATIRGIARRAKVDPSLVMQRYGSKAALFNSAIQLGEAGPGEIEAHLHDVLDVRLAALARHFLQLDAFARASDADIARVARPWVTAAAGPATGQHSPAPAPAG